MGFRSFAALPLLLLILGAAPALRGASYTITPDLSAGGLTALRVELRLRGGPDGREVLDLPADDAPGHPHLADFTVEGARVADDGPDRKILTFAPGRALTVRYRLLASDRDPETQGRGPLVRPDWFAVHGEAAFVAPEGRDGEAASVRLSGVPAGWLATANRSSTTLGKVRDGFVLGGKNWRELRRPAPGGDLRLVFPPRFAGQAEAALKDVATVAAAERAFWRAPGEPFFVGIVPLADDGQYEGRGLDGGFALFLGARAPKTAWLHLLAHEHMHAWISRRIGGFPEVDADLEAWLNEGFTEAYTARALLEAGLWTPQQFVDDWNVALLRYGTSPVKTAPNRRILADRMRDFDVQKLPYDRGRLLAALWNAEFEGATGGRAGLADVLRAQVRRAAANARSGTALSADRLFPLTAKAETGVDISSAMARNVDRGEAITLPNGLFGPCVEMVEVVQPEFDRGFNLGATLRARGRVAELEPGGPAERAGLREGDHVLVDEIPSRDSQTPLTYRVVQADGAGRTVSYRPEGTGTVRFQQLRLTDLAKRDPAGCARSLARP